MLEGLIDRINKKEYRWIAVLVSSILYLTVSTFMLVKYYMSFAVDEFYTLASLNPQAENLYHRHPYINKMVAYLGRIVDDNYYAGKLVPFIVGCICFAIIIIMLMAVCKSNVAIVIGAFAYTMNSMIIFNHLYIRHYVFAELAFILLAFGLYAFYSKRWNKVINLLLLLVGFAADFLYITQTRDDSVWGYEAFTVVVILGLILDKPIHMLLADRKRQTVIVALIVIILTGCVIFFGNDELMQIIPTVFRVKFDQFKGEIPVFWCFAVFTFSYVIAALIAFMCADNFESIRGMYPVWMLVFLASAAYIVAFPYNYLVRSFTPYIGVGIVFAVAFWDNVLDKKLARIIVSVVIIASTFLSYPNFQFRWFFTGGAGIYEESYFENYRDLLNDVKQARDDGYEVASMMSFKSQEYVLGLNPELSLSEFGDNNEELLEPVTAAEYIREKIAVGHRFVVVTSNFGGQLLEQTGLLDELKADYPYKNYNGTNQYLIYIN